ncbi:MAG: hypothetical protein ACI9TO_000799, partial [Rickettsiales bacterium]
MNWIFQLGRGFVSGISWLGGRIFAPFSWLGRRVFGARRFSVNRSSNRRAVSPLRSGDFKERSPSKGDAKSGVRLFFGGPSGRRDRQFFRQASPEAPTVPEKSTPPAPPKPASPTVPPKPALPAVPPAPPKPTPPKLPPAPPTVPPEDQLDPSKALPIPLSEEEVRLQKAKKELDDAKPDIKFSENYIKVFSLLDEETKKLILDSEPTEEELKDIGMIRGDAFLIRLLSIDNSYIFGFRPINEATKELMEAGAMGKNFTTKCKSSNIINGYIFYNSWFSKIVKEGDSYVLNKTRKDPKGNPIGTEQFWKFNNKDINHGSDTFFKEFFIYLFDLDNEAQNELREIHWFGTDDFLKPLHEFNQELLNKLKKEFDNFCEKEQYLLNKIPVENSTERKEKEKNLKRLQGLANYVSEEVKRYEEATKDDKYKIFEEFKVGLTKEAQFVEKNQLIEKAQLKFKDLIGNLNTVKITTKNNHKVKIENIGTFAEQIRNIFLAIKEKGEKGVFEEDQDLKSIWKGSVKSNLGEDQVEKAIGLLLKFIKKTNPLSDIDSQYKKERNHNKDLNSIIEEFSKNNSKYPFSFTAPNQYELFFLTHFDNEDNPDNHVPIYNQNSDVITDNNQRPIMLAKVGDGLYEFNYNNKKYEQIEESRKTNIVKILEKKLKKDSLAAIDKNLNKEDREKLCKKINEEDLITSLDDNLKNIESLSYSVYDKFLNEIRKAVTADYDGLTLGGIMIFPLENNMSDELVNELGRTIEIGDGEQDLLLDILEKLGIVKKAERVNDGESDNRKKSDKFILNEITDEELKKDKKNFLNAKEREELVTFVKDKILGKDRSKINIEEIDLSKLVNIKKIFRKFPLQDPNKKEFEHSPKRLSYQEQVMLQQIEGRLERRNCFDAEYNPKVFGEALNKLKESSTPENEKNATTKPIARNIALLEMNRVKELIDSQSWYLDGGLLSNMELTLRTVLAEDTGGNVNHGFEINNILFTEEFTGGRHPFFMPDGKIRIVRTEEEICELINELRDLGFSIPINPNWIWDVDSKGKLFVAGSFSNRVGSLLLFLDKSGLILDKALIEYREKILRGEHLKIKEANEVFNGLIKLLPVDKLPINAKDIVLIDDKTSQKEKEAALTKLIDECKEFSFINQVVSLLQFLHGHSVFFDKKTNDYLDEFSKKKNLIIQEAKEAFNGLLIPLPIDIIEHISKINEKTKQKDRDSALEELVEKCKKNYKDSEYVGEKLTFKVMEKIDFGALKVEIDNSFADAETMKHSLDDASSADAETMKHSLDDASSVKGRLSRHNTMKNIFGSEEFTKQESGTYGSEEGGKSGISRKKSRRETMHSSAVDGVSNLKKLQEKNEAKREFVELIKKYLSFKTSPKIKYADSKYIEFLKKRAKDKHGKPIELNFTKENGVEGHIDDLKKETEKEYETLYQKELKNMEEKLAVLWNGYKINRGEDEDGLSVNQMEKNPDLFFHHPVDTLDKNFDKYFRPMMNHLEDKNLNKENKSDKTEGVNANPSSYPTSNWFEKRQYLSSFV